MDYFSNSRGNVKMIADGNIALILYFLNPTASIFYLLAVAANVIEADYKGYYIVALAVFGVISRLFEMGVGRKVL